MTQFPTWWNLRKKWRRLVRSGQRARHRRCVYGHAADSPTCRRSRQIPQRCRNDPRSNCHEVRQDVRNRHGNLVVGPSELLLSRPPGVRPFRKRAFLGKVGPRPKSGSSETVGLAAPSPTTGVEVTGASFRIVVDVGRWDNSFAINSPGQDGDPRSEHYSDLYETWLSDGYFPLIYSSEALAEHVVRTISIRPKAAVDQRRQGIR